MLLNLLSFLSASRNAISAGVDASALKQKCLSLILSVAPVEAAACFVHSRTSTHLSLEAVQAFLQSFRAQDLKKALRRK